MRVFVLLFLILLLQQSCSIFGDEIACKGDDNLLIDGYVFEGDDTTPVENSNINITLYGVGRSKPFGTPSRSFNFKTDRNGYFRLSTCYPRDYLPPHHLHIVGTKSGHFETYSIVNYDTLYLDQITTYTLNQIKKSKLTVQFIKETNLKPNGSINVRPVGLWMGKLYKPDTTVSLDVASDQDFNVTLTDKSINYYDTLNFYIGDTDEKKIVVRF